VVTGYLAFANASEIFDTLQPVLPPSAVAQNVSHIAEPQSPAEALTSWVNNFDFVGHPVGVTVRRTEQTGTMSRAMTMPRLQSYIQEAEHRTMYGVQNAHGLEGTPYTVAVDMGRSYRAFNRSPIQRDASACPHDGVCAHIQGFIAGARACLSECFGREGSPACITT
jgi:hypothetical protein